MTAPRAVRLATRGSPLALAQADSVAARLVAAFPGLDVERMVVHTEGDRRSDAPLSVIGGQGVFVKEVQAAVLDGQADVAVHSAKDLPALTPDGLVLACVPERADPRDALVGSTLDGLGPGSVVATGSPRRMAQLANLRPDLCFVGLRGNMARRLEQAGSDGVHAVVAAAAALDRLGLSARVAERLDTGRCLPQVGQGAIALECRAGDEQVLGLLAPLDDPVAHRAVSAERAFLRALGAGCTLPVAAFAEAVGDPAGATLTLHGLLAGGDGRVVVRARKDGTTPEELGAALARMLVSDLGADSIDGWEALGTATVGSGTGVGPGAG